MHRPQIKGLLYIQPIVFNVVDGTQMSMVHLGD